LAKSDEIAVEKELTCRIQRDFELWFPRVLEPGF
jgi:hypothetical protein